MSEQPSKPRSSGNTRPLGISLVGTGLLKDVLIALQESWGDAGPSLLHDPDGRERIVSIWRKAFRALADWSFAILENDNPVKLQPKLKLELEHIRRAFLVDVFADHKGQLDEFNRQIATLDHDEDDDFDEKGWMKKIRIPAIERASQEINRRLQANYWEAL